MKILISDKQGRARIALDSSDWRLRAALACSVVLFMLTGALGLRVADKGLASFGEYTQLAQWREQFEADTVAMAATREQVDLELAALTAQVAVLQARIMRLDALGEQVAQVADLDHGEFDFSQLPALGGPELVEESAAAIAPDELQRQLDWLAALVENRESQLAILDGQLSAREMKSQAFVAGRPVKWGWMSSAFGSRTDPFTGKKAWHNGVDFAGKSGSDVVAIAGGVITAAEIRYGYGLMIEINHGNGFATRYAHNEENLVSVGDVIDKGTVVARMGSSGRSTGPHVHFEVLRNGKPMDPARYINRASL
ncbi:MAG: M23 family metallopeptidase [Pseudomonadales bacterium]